MSDAEVIAFVRSNFPGRLEAILHGDPLPPYPPGERPGASGRTA
jgi:hypothetical protein